MMVMVVMMIVVMVMMVVVIMMMIVVMVILSHDHRLVFRNSRVSRAFVLRAQDLLGIRMGSSKSANERAGCRTLTSSTGGGAADA